MSKFVILPTFLPETNLELSGYSLFLAQLLSNRGINTKLAAERYLAPNYEDGLHDPFLLHDMDAACTRILLAINNNERIIIYSDYDCDGIPGAVVLHDFFVAAGFSNFYNHIPHRHYDGFGLSVKAVEKLHTDQKPALIITIDCGTTDIEAVGRANELGIDVIITDHHEPKDILPEAVAIVNPKIGDTYPFTGLCGAAVIFKLAQALMARGNFAITSGQEKWWLDMVGIATIADMVPLVDENRILAHYGLKVLRKSRRPGLQKLLHKQKASQQHLTEDDIGFTIGPRINAASRMDTPEDAFMMLSTKDEGEAGAYVDHLDKLNTNRKTAVAQMTKEINHRLESLTELPPVFVMGNPDWRPSLVGLAANKLASEHGRPAFIWGRDGNGVLKGSCRSGGNVSVVTLMNGVEDIFLEFGGHHMSGGFSVQEGKIHDLASALIDEYQRLGSAAILDQPHLVDMELTLEGVTREILNAQRQCAPFGMANPKPIYLIKNVTPSKVVAFGKAHEHTKLTFITTGIVNEAIAFFKTVEQFSKVPTAESACSVLVHLEESFFMGRMQKRFRIIDVI
jgi:single-stranded-DNA-specific exonuclease